jgi:hypothetical protein
MPAGLQAWDADGNLVVDLGDYTVKFVGRYSMSIASNASVSSITVNGIDGNNSFASIQSSNGTVDGSVRTDIVAKTKTNGVDLIYMPTGTSGGVTADVEVYMFV